MECEWGDDVDPAFRTKTDAHLFLDGIPRRLREGTGSTPARAGAPLASMRRSG